jgi:hypothetical protein
MRNKQIHLKIEKPCHENWQSMTPNEKGKFCLHCQKTVIDFTQMIDSELINYVELNTGKLCGRLTKQQNDRLYTPYQSNSNIGPIYNLVAGILLLGTTIHSNAQNQNPKNDKSVEVEVEQTLNKIKSRISKESNLSVDSSIKYIKGIVIDKESKEALVGVSLNIIDSRIYTATDKNGNFVIEIPEDFQNQEILLAVNYIGYEPFRIKLNLNELPDKNIFELKLDQIFLGEMIIV